MLHTVNVLMANIDVGDALLLNHRTDIELLVLEQVIDEAIHCGNGNVTAVASGN
jgi:hypothetical protein